MCPAFGSTSFLEDSESVQESSASHDTGSDSWQNRLQQSIDRAAHLLPAQGPIPVFIHHNTLHAFEDLKFSEAVVKGGEVFGCQPFLSEARYRDELAQGRIRFEDLDAVLHEVMGAGYDFPLAPGCTRLQLRQAILQSPIREGATTELLWHVAETDALRRVRPEVSAADRAHLVAETHRWALRDLRGGGATIANRWGEILDLLKHGNPEEWNDREWERFALQSLWLVCVDGANQTELSTTTPPVPIRHRDLLLDITGVDCDRVLNDVLIRFCAAFVDQGLAHWTLPERKAGFFACFCAMFTQPFSAPDAWRRGLASELRRIQAAGLTPLDSIRESLSLLGVSEAEWDDYLGATLLALRGWGGIIRFLEERPDRAVHPPKPQSLLEFVAVRLLLDRLAIAHVAKQTIGYAKPLSELRTELRDRIPPNEEFSVEQGAFPVFQLAQILRWTPEDLSKLQPSDWKALIAEIAAFNPIERRRVFHLAYERRFYIRSLDAISRNAGNPSPTPRPARFQAIFCIDEREESIRRHLEEVAPDVQTFGTAGFFSVAMYFKGCADAHYTPLCPAVFLPKHWVTEEVVADPSQGHHRRERIRRAVGSAAYHVHVGTRTFMTGALLAVVGVVASIPLVARTMFPRLTARLRARVGGIVRTSTTRLKLERSDPTPGSEGKQIGFSLDEMTNIGEKVLRDIGLTSGFSPLVFVIGHGSTSMNNPHESAHDCGACGGSRGGPNGRALAQILNEPRVRAGIARRGIHIPEATHFVGGMHNTSSEAFTLADVDVVPSVLRPVFEKAHRDLEKACDYDAHERARRFASAPLNLTRAGARRHMEGRAEDLSQVRPEWGHATNALCIVARRERTRGLFLDRRAFLNSYDPTQDDENATVLTRTLQAVFPVCGGINLEYYFSYVDNFGYGCGTKLPHNITSLLGVMDGSGSDLRTGLPWQMVEIHEPVRLLFVLETRPEVILGILDRHPPLARLVRNEWIQLAVLDPNSSAIQFFKNGKFEAYRPQTDALPRAASSIDWYRGWRDHLEFAQIGREVTHA